MNIGSAGSPHSTPVSYIARFHRIGLKSTFNLFSSCQTLVIPAYPKSYGVHIGYSVSPQNNHYVESPMCYMLWHDFCVFIRLSHKYVLKVPHMFGIVTNTVGNHTNRIGNHTNVFGIISIEWGISDGLSNYNHRKFGIQTSIFSEKISPANDGLFVIDGLFVLEGLYV